MELSEIKSCLRIFWEAIRKAFAEPEEIALSLEVNTVDVEGEDESIDREYALRKIGIRGVG